jgi:DnaJ-class molecular chaperone
MEDYYKVLGVSEKASGDEIKRAFRKLSLKHHPDRGGDADVFKKINEAYQTLGDAEKREMYKMRKGNLFGNFNASAADMDPFLRMFFGGMPGGMPGMPGGMPGMSRGMPGMPGGMPNVQIFRNGRPINMGGIRKPEPLIKNITINLTQSYSGINYPLVINRWILVNNVKKTETEKIYFPIPKGIDSGEIIIIRDKGNCVNNTLRGDLKLHITVKNDTEFKREGLNLTVKKSITLKQSLTGFTFNVKHINGKTYTINNDKGNIIPVNYSKEINNLGMSRDNNIGKLIIKFDILFPEKLTNEQIDKLKEIL